MTEQIFAAGPVVATVGVADLGLDLLAYVRRHLSGDFGTCGQYAEIDLTEQEDLFGALATADNGKLNVYAVRHGGRVLSAYDTPSGRLWVITDGIEPGGNAGEDTYTTCLLPDEY